MKLRTLTAVLLTMACALPGRADRVTNANQLAELRALSFSVVQRVLVARLSAPTTETPATFHGCAVRSEWRDVPVNEAAAVTEVLRRLIADGADSYAKAGDADVVWLQPLGVVYGECGLRLETDRGRREFSIAPGPRTDYVFASDGGKHPMNFVAEGPRQGMIERALSSLMAAPAGPRPLSRLLLPPPPSIAAAQPAKFPAP